MTEYKNSENFFSQRHIDLIGYKVAKNEKYKFYKLADSGQIIGEVRLRPGLGGEHIEIAQFTDVHLNYCFPDAAEDAEVINTRRCRSWLSGGESVSSVIRSLEVGKYCDQTVITGDILDYLSLGALYLAKALIFDRFPDIICTLGGHDATKEMETGKKDMLSQSELLNILEKHWIHDIYYFSKEIRDKIIAVGLNNGTGGRYFQCQTEKLRKDILKARAENKYMLVFQHEPISTGNPDDTCVEPVFPVNSAKPECKDFYNTCNYGVKMTDPVSIEMYRLLTENSDVIKGIFCGHLHSAYYTEIKGYDPVLKKECSVPQIAALGNPYFGHIGNVTRIIIE